MTEIAAWAKEYVGIPFASNGRTKEGADCYGLVRLVRNGQFGGDMPLLSGDYKDADNFAETERVMREQQPLLAGQSVEAPEIGDVCVLKFRGMPVHAGIYAGGGYALHTLKHTGSILQRVSDPQFSTRLEGWYHVNG
jgi:cell wall-associated NlpC family hydrolase